MRCCRLKLSFAALQTPTKGCHVHSKCSNCSKMRIESARSICTAGSTTECSFWFEQLKFPLVFDKRIMPLNEIVSACIFISSSILTLSISFIKGSILLHSVRLGTKTLPLSSINSWLLAIAKPSQVNNQMIQSNFCLFFGFQCFHLDFVHHNGVDFLTCS